jgi:zinc protease
MQSFGILGRGPTDTDSSGSANSPNSPAMALPQPLVGQIGGIPAVWVKGPGLTSAGLVFRVGQLDELLPQRGWTHLIEHLALSRFQNETFSFNGFTGWCTTSFVCRGTSDEVTKFILGTVNSLNFLPFDRLDREAGILRTEQCQRGTFAHAGVFTSVYGAVGPGLMAFPEFGVRDPNADRVDAWRRQHFTGDNAYLWFCGPEQPPEMTLNLPAGEGRRPVLGFEPIAPLPTWVATNGSSVMLSAAMNDTAALGGVLATIERRLTDRLRRDDGLTYNASSSRISIGPDLDLVFLSADHRQGDGARVQEAMASELGRMMTDPPTEQDLVPWRTAIGRFYEYEPGAAEAVASGWAETCLLGGTPVTPEAMLSEVGAVTREEMVDVAKELAERAAWGMPSSEAISDQRIPAVRSTSLRRAQGECFPQLIDPKEGTSAIAIVRSEECVSLAWSAQDAYTVGFNSLAIVEIGHAGELWLLDRDGFTIRIVPGHWDDGERLAHEVLAACPKDRIVRALGEPAVANASNPTKSPSSFQEVVVTSGVAQSVVLAAQGGQRLVKLRIPSPSSSLTPVSPFSPAALIRTNTVSNLMVPTSMATSIVTTVGERPHLVALVVLLVAAVFAALVPAALVPLLLAAVVCLVLTAIAVVRRPVRVVANSPHGAIVRCESPGAASALRRAVIEATWTSGDKDAKVLPGDNEYFDLLTLDARAVDLVDQLPTLRGQHELLSLLHTFDIDTQLRILQRATATERGRGIARELVRSVGPCPIGDVFSGFIGIAEAWEARGSGYANTVSRGGADVFLSTLREAEIAFRRVSMSDNSDQLSRIGLLVTGKGLIIPLEEKMNRWADVVRVAPATIVGAQHHLQSIAPKWSGDSMAMMAFADALIAEYGPSHPLAGVAMMAHIETAITDGKRKLAARSLERDTVVKRMAEAVRQHPTIEGLQALNEATAAAWYHGEPSAKIGLAAIGSRLVAQPWSYFPSGPRLVTRKTGTDMSPKSKKATKSVSHRKPHQPRKNQRITPAFALLLILVLIAAVTKTTS